MRKTSLLKAFREVAGIVRSVKRGGTCRDNNARRLLPGTSRIWPEKKNARQLKAGKKKWKHFLSFRRQEADQAD